MMINIEIDNLLLQLSQQIHSILMEKFVGMYVGGSIANNNFNLLTSDIDCYIITSDKLPTNIINKIEEIHKKFYSSQLPHAKKIEASYISKNDLLNFDPNITRPYFNEGSFFLAEYGSNFIIELYILREKGLTVVGPDIKDLIKKISKQDLQQAIKKNLKEYWEPSLRDLSKYKRDDYQVFAILTMCRTLYTLKMNRIASKTAAAQWALKNIDATWSSLIEETITLKQNSNLNKQEETREFVRYVIQQSSSQI